MTIQAAIPGIPEVRIEDCPIRQGFKFYRNFWHMFFVPTVAKVGIGVRVSGGWLVPVKFKNGWLRKGRCALLRYYGGEGAFTMGDVIEHESAVWSCQYNLMHSADVPQVVRGPDAGVLYLEVCDSEGYAHELRLKGLLGTHGQDECVALYTHALDRE